MKKALLYYFVLMCSIPVLYAQSPEDIVRKSREVMTVSSFEAYSTLTIIDARGNERIRKSTMASRSYPDGSEKRVIRFTAPPEVAGTGILIFDYADKQDDMWIYLPAMRQTRRIVSSEKSKSFMGSEFTNADMSAPLFGDFSYTSAGDEVLNGQDCWVIESKPKNTSLESEYGYARAVRYYSKKDYLVLLTLYYNFDGELIKTIKTDAYHKVAAGDRYMITRMQAINHANGRRSEMQMENIREVLSDEKYFTVSWLEKYP